MAHRKTTYKYSLLRTVIMTIIYVFISVYVLFIFIGGVRILTTPPKKCSSINTVHEGLSDNNSSNNSKSCPQSYFTDWLGTKHCLGILGCNGWNGSFVHPNTEINMENDVDISCNASGGVNTVNRLWNKSWIDDIDRKAGGENCIGTMDGYGCRSGLCLKSKDKWITYASETSINNNAIGNIGTLRSSSVENTGDATPELMEDLTDFATKYACAYPTLR
jgi:hypothetical protein